MEPMALSQEDQETVKRLLRQIVRTSRHNSGAALAAERELQAMGWTAATAIHSLLEPQIRRKREQQRKYRRMSLVSYFGMFAGLALVHLFASHPPGRFNLIALPFLALGTIAPLMLLAEEFDSPKTTTEVEALLRINDKRILDILMDVRCLVSGDKVANELSDTITRLLPTLNAADADLLSPENYARLNRTLHFCNKKPFGRMMDKTYVLAILKAFEQVGNHTSLPFVERLAKSAPEKAVREAAQACLPFLQSRATQQGETLLRAASAETVRPELLLHPADTASQTEAQELLRAGNNKDKQG